MNLGTLYATLGVDTTALVRAEMQMRKFAASTKASVAGINKTLKSTGSAMQSVGKSMSMYLTLPLTVAGGATFKFYRDFEANMSKVIGLVGVSKDQVEAWKQDILDLAPAVGKGPKELSDALFFITSAGLRGADAMDVLEMSAKAAAAGLGDTKVVADLVTSAMNAYGPAVLNAQQATDALVATVREGKAEPAALAASLGQVLPIASQMGATFQDVGASIAAMTRTGTNAETAAMQLKNILNALLSAKPGTEAETALRNMKTSSIELRDVIQKQGLLAALMKIKDLMNTYGEDVASRVFPNIRALSGILDLLGKNMESNVAIFKALKDNTGDTAIAFAEASQTVEQKMNVAMSKLQVSAVQIGETVSKMLIPVINKLADTIASVGKWFASLTESQQKWIVGIAAVVAAAGPMLTIFGVFVGKVIPLMLTGIASLTSAFSFLTAAIAANPIGALIVAATALVGVLVMVSKHTKDVSATFTAMKKVQDAVSDSTRDEIAHINSLMAIIKNENTTRNQKVAAIKELNKISPEYLGFIDEDALKTGEATQAIDAYISKLKEKATAQAAQELLIENEKKRLEDLASGQDKSLTFWEKAIKGGLAYASGLNFIYKQESILANEQEWGRKKAKKAQEEFNKTQDFYVSQINDISSSEKNLATQYDFVRSRMEAMSKVDVGAGQAEQVKNTKALIEQQINAETNFTKYLEQQLQVRLDNDTKYQELTAKIEEQKTKQKENPQLPAAAFEANIKLLQRQADAEKQIAQGEIITQIKAHNQRLDEYKQFAEKMGQSLNVITNLQKSATGGEVTVINPAAKEALAEYEKQMQIINNTATVMGSDFDAVSKRIEVTATAIQKLTEAGITSGDKIGELVTNFKSLNKGLEVSKAVQAFNDSMTAIGNMSKLLSSDFDDNAAKIDTVKSALQSFAQVGITTNEQFVNAIAGSTKQFNNSLSELRSQLAELQKQGKGTTEAAINLQVQIQQKEDIGTFITDLQNKLSQAKLEAKFELEIDADFEKIQAIPNIIQTMDANLAEASTKAMNLGDSFSLTNAQIEIYGQAIDAIKAKGTLVTKDDLTNLNSFNDILQKLKYKAAFEDMSKALTDVNNKAAEYGGSVGVLNKQTEIYANTLNAIRGIEGIIPPEYQEQVQGLIDLLTKLGYQFDNVKEQSSGSAEFFKNIFEGMSNVISNALNSTENILQAFFKFFVDWIKGMVIKLVAATVAALALAVALSAIGIGPGLTTVFKGLSQASKFGDIFKAGFKSFGGFAKGGIIPQGYPNDSFPAMLTSGEMVVPVNEVKTVKNAIEIVGKTNKETEKNVSSQKAITNVLSTNNLENISTLTNAENRENDVIKNVSSSQQVLKKILSEKETAKKEVESFIRHKNLTEIISKDIARMNEGGIIPAGYPNDSYPAMLTSGEMVVPVPGVAKIQETINRAGEINNTASLIKSVNNATNLAKTNEVVKNNILSNVEKTQSIKQLSSNLSDNVSNFVNNSILGKSASNEKIKELETVTNLVNSNKSNFIHESESYNNLTATIRENTSNFTNNKELVRQLTERNGTSELIRNTNETYKSLVNNSILHESAIHFYKELSSNNILKESFDRALREKTSDFTKHFIVNNSLTAHLQKDREVFNNLTTSESSYKTLSDVLRDKQFSNTISVNSLLHERNENNTIRDIYDFSKVATQINSEKELAEKEISRFNKQNNLTKIIDRDISHIAREKNSISNIAVNNEKTNEKIIEKIKGSNHIYKNLISTSDFISRESENANQVYKELSKNNVLKESFDRIITDGAATNRELIRQSSVKNDSIVSISRFRDDTATFNNLINNIPGKDSLLIYAKGNDVIRDTSINVTNSEKLEKEREIFASVFNNVTKMASGGIVPKGYPNDTFPAFLTSGEMVIPVKEVQQIRELIDNRKNESTSITNNFAGQFAKNTVINSELSRNENMTNPVTNLVTSDFYKGITSNLINSVQNNAGDMKSYSIANFGETAVHMAQGGTVPSGYSNDNYPVMLSSGETVLPPNKLPEMNSAMDITIKVEGIARGQDIHYVVKEVERRFKNSY